MTDRSKIRSILARLTTPHTDTRWQQTLTDIGDRYYGSTAERQLPPEIRAALRRIRRNGDQP